MNISTSSGMGTGLAPCTTSLRPRRPRNIARRSTRPCPTAAVVRVERGLYGALIVRGRDEKAGAARYSYPGYVFTQIL